MNDRIRRMLGCVALALACIMIGSGMSQTFAPAATAEEVTETVTVVHTSPFTAAVADVRDSVVGISNYQQVTYGGYGYGFGYGYNYGSSSSSGTLVAQGGYEEITVSLVLEVLQG